LCHSSCEFPPSEDPLMLHAKEGWKYVKEVKRLAGLYPECLGDQTFMNGEWVMLTVLLVEEVPFRVEMNVKI
jgi:hypothetical protein